MSFFFDVWSSDGFVLASDVKLLRNGQEQYAHKIATAPEKSNVVCALAVCGDYPKNCLRYFKVATMTKDSLKEISAHFASDWTKFYAGSEWKSAVHLVGFENIPSTGRYIPQMWYWYNWTDEGGFVDEKQLQKNLESFIKPTPMNNHIPWKIHEMLGKHPPSTPDAEYELVLGFLRLYQPFFTWNGDNSFWRSAAQAVGSAGSLLGRNKPNWTMMETAQLTELCLLFLVNVGNLLPISTVGLSPGDDADILTVTPEGTDWIKRAKLPEETSC